MDLDVPDQKTVEARRIDLNFFDKRFYSPNKVKIQIRGKFVKGVINKQFQDDVK